MAAENKRQVIRREPIIVETNHGDFEAHPLPWPERNKLGDMILQSYIESVRAMMGMLDKDEDGNIKGGRLDDVVFDWPGLLLTAFPSVEKPVTVKLDIFELRAIMGAALEVNGLEHMGYMIDPNFESPAKSQETLDPLPDGPKTTSSPDSGLLGTPE